MKEQTTQACPNGRLAGQAKVSICRMILHKQCICDGFGSYVDISQSSAGCVCVHGMENHFGNASQAQYKSFDKSSRLGLKHSSLSIRIDTGLTAEHMRQAQEPLSFYALYSFCSWEISWESLQGKICATLLSLDTSKVRHFLGSALVAQWE